MQQEVSVKHLDQAVVLFSGDSGDGMQLAGNIFSTVCATLGEDICTFPDYPAEIRAPQGTLGGVSGFRVHAGHQVTTPGDTCHVLVAMNPAALKQSRAMLARDSVVIIDQDTFTAKELEKAEFTTDNPFSELGIQNNVIAAPLSSMCLSSLAEVDMAPKDKLKCRNIMALGLVCWMFEFPLDQAEEMLRKKFAKKPAVAEANLHVLHDGYNYGHNTHVNGAIRYKIERHQQEKGTYTEINGNTALAYGLIAAAEKAGMQLFLGSYPITPATDILHELAKHKNLGVKTIQCEDEISACCMALGASYAGSLAVTSTSGPGLCLKSEAINLSVMAELPLVVIDVQRGGPSTGLPTKTEQGDLLQALYGRNGESPLPVVSATSPYNCFDTAYAACKIAVERMTPVIILSDSFTANGSSTWRIPRLADCPSIQPHDLGPDNPDWKPYQRDPHTKARFRVVPGKNKACHVIGGLEKDHLTGKISYDAQNHELMIRQRAEKVQHIATCIPPLQVVGTADAELLVVGWGGTYGHLLEAVTHLQKKGKKIALAHFQWLNPLPTNTEEVLRNYPKIIVAEQNNGQFAGYLRTKFQHLPPMQQYNKIQGQPFNVEELEAAFIQTLTSHD